MPAPYVLDEQSFAELKRQVQQQRYEISSLRRHLQHTSVRRHQSIYMPASFQVVVAENASGGPYTVPDNVTLTTIKRLGSTIPEQTSTDYLALPSTGIYLFGYTITGYQTQTGSPSAYNDARLFSRLEAATDTVISDAPPQASDEVFFSERITQSATGTFRVHSFTTDFPRVQVNLNCSGSPDVRLADFIWWVQFLGEEWV